MRSQHPEDLLHAVRAANVHSRCLVDVVAGEQLADRLQIATSDDLVNETADQDCVLCGRHRLVPFSNDSDRSIALLPLELFADPRCEDQLPTPVTDCSSPIRRWRHLHGGRLAASVVPTRAVNRVRQVAGTCMRFPHGASVPKCHPRRAGRPNTRGPSDLAGSPAEEVSGNSRMLETPAIGGPVRRENRTNA
jgi:hypothetical protein